MFIVSHSFLKIYKQMMKSGINSIETDDDVECIWVAAPLDEQINEPMCTIPSQDQCTSYGSYEVELMKICKSKIKGSIKEGASRIHEEHTKANVQTQMEETLVDMLCFSLAAGLCRAAPKRLLHDFKRRYCTSFPSTELRVASCQNYLTDVCSRISW